MHLSPDFERLFRDENNAIELALMESKQLDNPYMDIFRHTTIPSIYEQDFGLVPIGEGSGRNEAEAIKEQTMSTGWSTTGATAIEYSHKMSVSETLKSLGRRFTSSGRIDEKGFSGYLADTFTRQMLSREAHKWHVLAANLFNLGGIQAGHNYFNHRLRALGHALVPNTTLIYDGSPLFALPTAPHTSYVGGVAGIGSAAVGTTVDFAGTIADTGGYFNAFLYPPSYWALKRVYTHYVNNMQYDENDVKYGRQPDTLVVSSFDIMRWMEILKSRFVEPTAAGNTTNRENVFQMGAFPITLKQDPLLLPRTWFLGKVKTQAINILTDNTGDDPWSFYRNEDNRAYYVSYEHRRGFWIKDWRAWVAGAISLDGETAPDFGAEDTWDEIPAGV